MTAAGADALTIEGLSNGREAYFRIRPQDAAGQTSLMSESVWEIGNPFPVQLQLREPRVPHAYDPDSRVFNRRDPLLLQFRGQTMTTIGAVATRGVTCVIHPGFGGDSGHWTPTGWLVSVWR